MTAAGCQRDGKGWAGCWAVRMVLKGFWIRVARSRWSRGLLGAEFFK